MLSLFLIGLFAFSVFGFAAFELIPYKPSPHVDRGRVRKLEAELGLPPYPFGWEMDETPAPNVEAIIRDGDGYMQYLASDKCATHGCEAIRLPWDRYCDRCAKSSSYRDEVELGFREQQMITQYALSPFEMRRP